MKYWNKMMVTFMDDTQVICDKILFDSLVPFSSGYDYQMPSFRLVINGEVDKERLFTKRDIKEVSPIHGVPLLITVVYYDHFYEFLRNDFTRQEQWSQQGFESFHEAYRISYPYSPYRIQYLSNQPEYEAIIHNEVERSQDNFRFMNNCPKMIRRDDDFLQSEHFPDIFLDAVFEEGIALYGRAGQDKCYLYSIEPLYLENPETTKYYSGGYVSNDICQRYKELSGAIDLSKKTIELKSNTEKWDFYSRRYDEYTFYDDYVTSLQRFSTRYQCHQYYEQLVEKCRTNSEIDIQSECDLFHIKMTFSSPSPIDWGELLSIRFTHHPTSW